MADPTKQYIGSTVRPLSARLGDHVAKYKSWKDGKYRYTSSFDILELGDYRIELLENCPCDNKEELRAREGHFIRQYDCINKHVAGRTKSQYRAENKEEIKQRKHKYYMENKKLINQKNKKWCEDNPERVKEYRREYCERNKEKLKEDRKNRYNAIKDDPEYIEKRKQYWEKNRNILNAKKRQYARENKEKIRARHIEPVTCEYCGAVVTRAKIRRHERTKKCMTHSFLD